MGGGGGATGGIQLISLFTYVHIREFVVLLNEVKSIHCNTHT